MPPPCPDPLPLLAAARNGLAAIPVLPGNEGPFLCWGDFGEKPTAAALDSAQVRVLKLAADCCWPATWFSREPTLERRRLSSGVWVWVVDRAIFWDFAFYKTLAQMVVARLPVGERPQGERGPHMAGLAFVFRELRDADLLRTERCVRGHLHWFEGDGFNAALAAADALTHRLTQADDWTEARRLEDWAKVYSCHRNTFRKRLKEGKPRSRLLGKLVQIAVADLPLEEKTKYPERSR